MINSTKHIEDQKPVSWMRYWPAWLLVVVGIFLYGQSFQFEFVSWDDPWYVQNNGLIKSWTVSNLYGILTENVARNYAPLTIFSFLLDQTVYGDWAGGFHLTNVILHLVNSVLALKLVQQLTGNRMLSLFTAMCFLIHPLQVETVSWISSRKGLLSGTFMLLSMISWCRKDRTSKEEIWAYGFLLLALFSKAIAIIMPGLFFIFDYLYLKKKPGECVGKVLLPMLLCIMFLVWTAKAQTTIVGGVRDHIGMSKLDIILIDSVLCWKYVAMLVYPYNLSILYDPKVNGIPVEIAVTSISWLVILGIVISQRNRFPQLLFAFLSIAILMFPVMNFFPLTTLMNDRYLYLPIIPFFAALGGILQYGLLWVSGKLHNHKELEILNANSEISIENVEMAGQVNWLQRRISSLVFVLMMFMTSPWVLQNYERQKVWLSSHTLWEDTLKKVPQLAVVQIEWANKLQREGSTEEAIRVLEQALKSCRLDKQDESRIHKKIEAWSKIQ